MFAYSYKSYLYLSIGLLFVLLQFFLQLSFGVLVPSLVAEMQLDSVHVGILSACYYFTYVSLQMPAGAIIGVFGTRYSISFGAIFCGFCAYMFSQSHSFEMAFIARILMGLGSSFAFIGVAQLLLENFPRRQYPIMFGVTEAVAMSSALFSNIYFANLLKTYSWHHVFFIIAFIGSTIALLAWFVLPSAYIKLDGVFLRLIAPCRLVVKNMVLWVNGLYCGLLYSMVAAFSGLWAMPFLLSVQKAPLVDVTLESSLLFLGLACGSPVAGYLYNRYSCHKLFMALSALLTFILSLVLIYFTPESLIYGSILFFSLGFLCCGYIMCYNLVVDVVDSSMSGAAMGFTNTLGVIIAPILQVVIGYYIKGAHILHAGPLLVEDYQYGLKFVPSVALIALILSRYLPKRGV